MALALHMQNRKLTSSFLVCFIFAFIYTNRPDSTGKAVSGNVLPAINIEVAVL